MSIVAWEAGDPISVPARSRLYGLEPRGIGTAWVESQTSYTTRLAAAHAVTVQVLLSDELLPLFSKDYLQGSAGVGGSMWGKMSALNGTGGWAAGWATVLGRLTHRGDLGDLTMLAWATVVPPRGLLRRERAWCEACLDEWNTEGEPLYEPLLWAIQPVRVCPRHLCALVTTCRTCGRGMPPIAAHARVGSCFRCGISLAAKLDSPESWAMGNPAGREWEVYCASAIEHLLAAAQGGHGTPNKGMVASSLALYLNKAPGGDMRELARCTGVSLRSLRDILEGNQLPQLETVLRICYRLGASPIMFYGLQRLHEAYTLPPPTPAPGRRRKQGTRRVFPEAEVAASIRSYLDAGEEPPLSMIALARTLGWEASYLQKRLPLLCRAVSRRYRAHVQAAKEQAAHALRAEVRAVTLALHADGVYPSYRRVQAGLVKPRCMREPVAMQAWQDALTELGWEVRGSIKKRSLTLPPEDEPMCA